MHETYVQDRPTERVRDDWTHLTAVMLWRATGGEHTCTDECFDA